MTTDQADQKHRQLQHIEDCMADMHNLTSALQVLCWELCGQSIEHGTALAESRNGLVGIANAMASVVKRSLEAPKP